MDLSTNRLSAAACAPIERPRAPAKWRRCIARQGWSTSGRLEGKCDYYWKLEGHDVHEESLFEKGRVVKRKIYVDKLPVSEAEYMPDGSVKSQKRLKKSPVEGLVI